MSIKYAPFIDPTKEFRLLEIKAAANPSALLSATLKHHRLDDVKLNGLVYCALSYVWGEQTKNRVRVVLEYEAPKTPTDGMKRVLESRMGYPDSNNTRLSPSTEGRQTISAGCDFADIHFMKEEEDPVVSQNICGTNLQFFDITIGENLGLAIRHLRSESRSVQIWADALCINQVDDEEKSNQVQLMYSIYQSASFVLIWLGPSGNDTDAAMDTINEIGLALEKFSFHDEPILADPVCDIQNEERYCGIRQSCLKTLLTWFENAWRILDPKDSNGVSLRPFLDKVTSIFLSGALPIPEGTGSVLGLIDLCQRPYWRRIWVIQEYVAANELHFQCGERVTSANRFWMIWSLLWSYKRFYFFQHVKGFVGYHPIERKFDLEPVLNNLALFCRRRANYNLIQLLHSAYSGLERFTADDRDRVYALLGLAKASLGLIPDYRKNPLRVFSDTSKAALQAISHSPLEFFKTYDGSCGKEIPSWAVDWSGTVRYPELYSFLKDVHCSGGRGESRICFEPRSPEETASERMKMKIDGEHITKLIFVSDSLGEQDHLTQASSTLSREDMHNRFQNRWHLLCAKLMDMRTEWSPPYAGCPTVVDQIIEIALKLSRIPQEAKAVSDVKERLKKFMDGSSWDDKYWQQNQEAAEIITNIYRRCLVDKDVRMGITVDGRVIHTTAKCGLGDVIAIFYGAMFPFVLGSAGNGLYRILGTTYVHGIMDGNFSKENRKVESFEII
jgi:hypothetical protein